MASVYSTNESFACLFDTYCLGMYSWTCCPGNADVAMPASWPHAQLKRPPSCANEITRQRLLPVALTSLAKRSCPSWLILWMKDLLQPTQPGVTADLFQPANLFRRIILASVFVPFFRNLSGFVPVESC